MLFICALLLFAIPTLGFSSSKFDSANDNPAAPISIVILHTGLLFHPAGSGNGDGQLRVKWVLTSDVTALSDGRASIQPALFVSCPNFFWDDLLLNSRDSFPNTHCGGMFGTMFPLSADKLAAGVHSLRLTLTDLPASSFMSCDPSPCTDYVTIHIHPSSPTSAPAFTVEGHLMPGGIPMIFHRIWLSPPSLAPRPIPSTYQRYWRSWRLLHEPQGWKFVTWTAANLERLPDASVSILLSFNRLFIAQQLTISTCTYPPCCVMSGSTAGDISLASHLDFS
jgi:hypothetical protein